MVARKPTLVAAAGKSRLDGLKALRDVIAAEIANGPTGVRALSQTAPLARQLRDVLREIDDLEAAVPKGSVVDDLATRRTARRAGTADSGEPARPARKQRPRSG